MSSFFKNVEHWASSSHKVFHQKTAECHRISKELDNVYKDSAPSYCTVAKWLTEFKDPERDFEDALLMGHPSTINADESIEALERIVVRDRQISIRRLAEELPIIHETMNNHMGMERVCTRWVSELLTPIQRANRVDCCQEFLQQSEVNLAKFCDCIVTGDEFWIHH